MTKKRKAFTLIELLVVVAIIALLISILLPSLSRARELSKRLVCASNVKGMGTAFKIYANDFEENWPTVPFSQSATLIQWTVEAIPIGDGHSTQVPPPITQGARPNRQGQSTADGGSLAATTTLSVTRSLWMLVRTGDVTPKQYVCPSSGESIANEQNIDLYYDFQSKDYVSYGFQVPYGPFSTRASENIDPRMATASDEGPYTSTSDPGLPKDDTTNWDTTKGDFKTPQSWRKFNSPNHGGAGTGEGQNVLYGDGHATFEKTPIVGIDRDNIFTAMDLISSGTVQNPWPITSGRKPKNLNANFWYPGDGAITTTSDASTDSLIYP